MTSDLRPAFMSHPDGETTNVSSDILFGSAMARDDGGILVNAFRGTSSGSSGINANYQKDRQDGCEERIRERTRTVGSRLG